MFYYVAHSPREPWSAQTWDFYSSYFSFLSFLTLLCRQNHNPTGVGATEINSSFEVVTGYIKIFWGNLTVKHFSQFWDCMYNKKCRSWGSPECLLLCLGPHPLVLSAHPVGNSERQWTDWIFDSSLGLTFMLCVSRMVWTVAHIGNWKEKEMP